MLIFIYYFILVSSLQYDTGFTYKYSYQFTVLLNEDSNITSRSASVGQNVGYKVSSEFLISSLWQSPSNINEKFLKLEVKFFFHYLYFKKYIHEFIIIPM